MKPTREGACALLIFTRYPEPGRTKTRLIGTLGAEGAAALQRAMTVHTVKTARRLAGRQSVSITVCTSGAEPARFAQWLGPDLSYESQAEGDLGVRMHAACAAAFAGGAGRVVVIGADAPDLSLEHLQRAFAELERHDVVIGPALDGGYYLIGLRAPAPRLFEGIEWGIESVRARTLEIAEQCGLSVAQLEPLGDVDLPEDLVLWERRAAPPPAELGMELISVILPALNEAQRIGGLLSELAGEAGVELIVVDGGSGDGTPELAATYGAQVLRTEPGRALQMNAGAAAARGALLLFLHADTRLPAGFGHAVREAMRDPRVKLGAFAFQLDVRSPALRLIAFGANLRARWLGLPYGDQALFTRRADFAAAGGYADVPVLEDVILVRRLRAMGRLVMLREAATTSARKWQQWGTAYLTFVHVVAITRYLLGASPEAIARWMRSKLPTERSRHP